MMKSKFWRNAVLLLLLPAIAWAGGGSTGFSSAPATALSGGAAGEVLYQAGINTTGFTAQGTTGQSLISNGSSAPTWGTPGAATNATNIGTASTSTNATFYPLFVTSTSGNQAALLNSGLTFNPATGAMSAATFVGALSGNATSATTATNMAGGAGGSIPYQSGVNATAMLANGTAGQVLTSNGTTLAPSWQTNASTNISSTDDAATNATYYPVFQVATGNAAAKTSSTKLTFNPSTGTFQASVLAASSPIAVSSGGTGGATTTAALNSLLAPINNTSAGSDVALAIGQSAYVDIASGASAALHVATGDNQLYDLQGQCTGSTGNGSAVSAFLEPNNTTYTAFFRYETVTESAGATGTQAGYGSAFVIGGYDPRFFSATISTKTASKVVWVRELGMTNTSGLSIMNGATTWQASASSSGAGDVTTAWTSLGTITLPVATSTCRIWVRRLQ